MDRTKVHDAGVANLGREHDFVVSCGRRFSVSESFLQNSPDDATKSLDRLIDHHLRQHAIEGYAPLCDPLFAWEPEDA